MPAIRDVLLLIFLVSFCADLTAAADLDECRKLLIQGEYQQCIEMTAAEIEKGVYGESWHLVKAEAELRTGKYEEAFATTQKALERYGWSIRLRWAAREACLYLGQQEQYGTYAGEIAQLVQSSPWRYTDVENLVTLGHFVLQQGADARQAQDAFFTRARRNNSLHRTPVLALGNLALEKRDFQLAAEIFESGLEAHPDDPEILFGLARAFADSDRAVASGYLEKSLLANPHYAPAILFQVDDLIDSEQYDEANQLIEQVLKINPHHPQSLAFRAVILLLQSENEQAQHTRKLALAKWTTNPEVDHTIGRKLSQKYRFEQGATYQRQALEFDATFRPAKKQLIQDLLRLGQEEEGWKLADEVYQEDPYDVAVFNLVTLRDELEKFSNLEQDGFIVRMSSQEAEVYGARVLKLLSAARDELTRKYDQELPETILVEIFPRPADFEVRTFGMPGIVGFLGVCFGDVITANSPASQNAHPVNLDAVLWHEFAHVVTLNKTNNRMPRWLSEGISVYEERQRDSSWGEQMNIPYRKMILDGELSPIGEMSQMFLSPKSPLHVRFAYFQSSLIVAYIIENYGFDKLLKVLEDLSVGIDINESLERHTTSLVELDEDFAEFATKLAEDFAKGVDLTPPEKAEIVATDQPAQAAIEWADANPMNYMGLIMWAQLLMDSDELTTAVILLQRAITLFPHDTSADGPRLMLADIYRRQGEIDLERKVLTNVVERDDDAAAALLRLVEITQAQEDWEALIAFAEKLLSIKPLLPQSHAAIAISAERLNDPVRAVAAFHSLIALDPTDPADLYYRKAIQHQQLNEKKEARDSVLRALEAAPRYREALALLRDLKR